MTIKNNKEDKLQKGEMKFPDINNMEIDPFRLKVIDGYNLTKRYGEDIAIRILHLAAANITINSRSTGR